MHTIVGLGKTWRRLSFADKGIWLFCAVNTLALLTLIKIVIFGK